MGKRKPSSGKKTPPKKGASGLWLFGVLAFAIIALVVIRIASNHASGTKPAADASMINQPVSSAIIKDLASAPLKTVPNQGWTNPTPSKGSLPDVGKKPVFLYIGAEYCPFCAAERWAMIVALDRFGSFKNLHYMLSTASDVYPNTPTFTFYGSTYSSRYVDFQPVETTRRNENVRLQTPSTAQYNYFRANNSQGQIPFVAVGGKYVWVGSAYQPTALKGRTWDEIARAVDHPTSGSVGGQILQNANVLTAAICHTDGGKPASVCTSPAVKSLISALP